MTKVIMLATEAKSAALQQLAVSSVRSSHLATGTGTDQIVVAAITGDSRFIRDSASGHLKLGELVATAVRRATLKALRQQNQLTPAVTARVSYVLARFGFDRSELLTHWQTQLSAKQYALAARNLDSMLSNTRVVASAYAYAALLDRIQYQSLGELAALEALRDQAAQVAVSLSGKSDQWPDYWQQLNRTQDPITLFADALLLGWQTKWPDQEP